MKDFNEIVLTLQVHKGLGYVYKKAIEDENSRYWVKKDIKSAGSVVISDIKPVWNGNHAHVEVDTSEDKDALTISLISHTLPNLLETASWYERMGAEVIYKTVI